MDGMEPGVVGAGVVDGGLPCGSGGSNAAALEEGIGSGVGAAMRSCACTIPAAIIEYPMTRINMRPMALILRDVPALGPGLHEKNPQATLSCAARRQIFQANPRCLAPRQKRHDPASLASHFVVMVGDQRLIAVGRFRPGAVAVRRNRPCAARRPSRSTCGCCRPVSRRGRSTAHGW